MTPSLPHIARTLLLATLLLQPAPATAGLGGALARGAGRGAGRAFARGAGRAVERSAARSVARGSERAAARGASRAIGRSATRSVARGSERAFARGAGRATERSVTRSGGRSLRRIGVARPPSTRQLAAIDRMRHRAVRPHPLSRARTVRRAVTVRQLHIDRQRGIAPNAHLTARRARGRMPTAETFKRRYHPFNRRSRVETVRVRKGTPVRVTRAAGGTHDEMTSPRRMPPSAIVGEHHLAHAARH
jgi:hypothetical protein